MSDRGRDRGVRPPFDDGIADLPVSGELPEGSLGSLGGAGGFNPLAIGSAAVLLLAAWTGLQSQLTPDPGPSASAAPTVAASASAVPSLTAPPATVPVPEPTGGPVSFAINDVQVVLTLPAGWEAAHHAPDLVEAFGSGQLGIGTTDRFAGTCLEEELTAAGGDRASPMVVPAGEVPGILSPAPVDFMLAAYRGRYFEFTRRSTCRPNLLWQSLVGNGLPRSTMTRLQLWVIDVGGTRLVFGAYTDLTTPLADLEEIRAIVASARIGAATVAADPGAPTPRPIPWGWGVNPGGAVPARQSVQVDGIGFSFQVPDSGWGPRGDPAGTLSLNKSIVGPQGAEAIVFWAPLAGGSQVRPCASVPALDPAGPLVELGQAMATTPGTSVIIGPAPATVGGYPAVSVTVSVGVDLGCDPGYLYAWDEFPGGALWPETLAGDTLRAWIVEAPSARLFIGGITHPNGEVLDDQVRSIVDSIEFP